MRALVFAQYGEPGRVVGLLDVPRPDPGPGEVRVEVRARPVNPSDLLYVQGRYGRPARFATPVGGSGHGIRYVSPIGFEGAGVVDAVGAGVTGPAVGARVAVSATGTWQEYVCAPADSVLPLGDEVSLEEGCQMMINPFTARLLLREAGLRAGDTVLVTAGASAVGRMIACLAHRSGIRCLSVLRHASQVPLMRELGAEPVLSCPASSLEEDLVTATGGRGADAALDAVGGPTGGALLSSLRPGARMVVYGLLSERALPVPPRDLVFRGVSVSGFWLPTCLERMERAAVEHLADDVGQDVAGGLPGLEVRSRHDLAGFEAALTETARTGSAGKVLLRS